AERLANVGKAPELTQIQNPQLQAGCQPVRMPMPMPKAAHRQPNSLWDSNRQAFFKDQRAANVGDILTVVIQIKDKAELDNQSARSRSSNEGAGMDNLLGIESNLGRIFPEAIDNSNLVDQGSTSNHSGQ